MARQLASLASILTMIFAATSMAAVPYQKEKKEKPAREKPSVYIVVQVNEDFQVIRREEFKDFQKSQMEAYKNSLKSYNEAKRAAQKEKTKFEEAKPVPPKIKPLGGQFTDMTKAQQHADKLRAEMEEEKTKSKGKKQP